MGFGEAIATCLRKYATFSGRARRSEYWYFFLFNLIIAVVADVIGIAADMSWIGVVPALALLLPGLAATVRRLHDTSRSAWYLLFAIIPFVGAIILIVFNSQDSDSDQNRYGDSPKYGALPPAVAHRY